MNVGAIGGYQPISYTSPYEAVPVGTKPTDNTSSTDRVTPAGQTADKKVEKTDPGYKCETCANRKYQDGSNEADVSFKSASHVAPEAAASAVRSHEQMHVTNAYQKAEQKNGKVINASVSIHTSICPECGKTYVSGGTTRTTIKYGNEDNPYQKNLKNMQGGFLRGINLDMKA